MRGRSLESVKELQLGGDEEQRERKHVEAEVEVRFLYRAG